MENKMLRRINMMELREAPGEVLERMRWNHEEFALIKQGKLAGFIVSRDFMMSLKRLLPLKVPCDFCCVNIMGDGKPVHEDNCPANYVQQFFLVEPVKERKNGSNTM
jgi:hypothetical protein